MPEGVRGDPLGEPGLANGLFEGFLHVGLMQMVTLALPGLRDAGQVGPGEEPLPDEFPGAVCVFFSRLSKDKTTGYPAMQNFIEDRKHPSMALFS